MLDDIKENIIEVLKHYANEDNWVFDPDTTEWSWVDNGNGPGLAEQTLDMIDEYESSDGNVELDYLNMFVSMFIKQHGDIDITDCSIVKGLTNSGETTYTIKPNSELNLRSDTI